MCCFCHPRHREPRTFLSDHFVSHTLAVCDVCAVCVLSVLQQGKTATAVNEVPNTYFPLRNGNRVTLYHDSVCTPGPVQGIALASGGLYSESSCWDDVYASIKAAKR